MRNGPEWQALLKEQSGIVSALQAGEHGWTSHALRAQLAAGRWTRPRRGVYVTTTGALEYEQRVWAAVLYGGDGAAASHEGALWLHDRRRPEPRAVHVSVPRSRMSVHTPGLRLYRTDLPAADVLDAAHPPRVRVERAVLDCAGAASDEASAIAAVTGAVQRRLTTPDRLLVALGRRRTLPLRRLLRQVIAMTGEGAHSLLELCHEQIRVGHGLPQPKRQVRHGKAVVDVDYDGLVVELDGRAGHTEVVGWWRDMLRDDLHTAHGRAVLRFPGFVLLTEPHVVAHLEAAALRSRGWTGSLRCPAGCPGLPAVDDGSEADAA